MTNKKIEEAAKNYLATKGKYYNTITKVWVHKAFIAGAQWQRKNVWHNIDESPKQDEFILVRFDIGHCNVWKVIEGNDRYMEMNGVVAWAYINDILPVFRGYND